MELDDFKNTWNRSGENATITPTNKLMELIQHKSYGPLAVLKATLARQFIFIPFTYAVLLWQVVHRPELRTDPFFGLFLGMILIASVFFTIAYVIVEKMQPAEGNVKTNLERQTASLEKILLGYRLTFFAGVILLAVFLEVFHDRGTALLMHEWYELAFTVRLGAYILLLVIGFFGSAKIFQRQFGQHIQNLNKLIQQLE